LKLLNYDVKLNIVGLKQYVMELYVCHFVLRHVVTLTEIINLKYKSMLMIFEKHANLKYKYGNQNFWCTGAKDTM
jgi:hypothetical protein